MNRQTSLTAHIVQFSSFLRRHGFSITVLEEEEILSSLLYIDWNKSQNFKLLLKSICCKNFRQYQRFDDLYSQYWSELHKAVDSKTKEKEDQQKNKPKQNAPSIESIKNWLHGNKELDETEIAKASELATEGQVSLSIEKNDNHKAWHEAIKLLQKQIANQPSRRYNVTNKTGMLNFRETLTNNMRFGGELVLLKFKKKKIRKTQIVLMCDVSKSMDLYSKFIIQMMYSLQNSKLKLNTFVFSTKLVNLSPILKGNDLDKTMSKINAQVDTWSSGTNIGDCFQELINEAGRKILTKRTFLFIVSDGWDGGDPKVLKQVMTQIKKKCNKIIWVNPLARNGEFVPEVVGMKTAMPFIDYLIPALDVEGFKRYLGKLS